MAFKSLIQDSQEGSDPSNDNADIEVALHRQGDPANSNRAVLAERQALRDNAKILQWIQVFWRTFDRDQSDKGLGSYDYLPVQKLLVKALHSDFEELQAMRVSLDDWEHDLQFAAELSQDKQWKGKLSGLPNESLHRESRTLDFQALEARVAREQGYNRFTSGKVPDVFVCCPCHNKPACICPSLPFYRVSASASALVTTNLHASARPTNERPGLPRRHPFVDDGCN